MPGFCLPPLFFLEIILSSKFFKLQFREVEKVKVVLSLKINWKTKYKNDAIPKDSGIAYSSVRFSRWGTFGVPTSKDMEFMSFPDICELNFTLDSVYNFLQILRSYILFRSSHLISLEWSVRNDSFTRLSILEQGKPATLWIKLTSQSSTKFIWCLNRSSNNSLSSTIDSTVSEFPFVVVRYVHNNEWLGP